MRLTKNTSIQCSLGLRAIHIQSFKNINWPTSKINHSTGNIHITFSPNLKGNVFHCKSHTVNTEEIKVAQKKNTFEEVDL